MSAETTSELEDAFRDLLLEISQKMNSNNPSELAFAAKCSECSGRSALDVLEELMRLGEFSATAPGNLANLLLRIKRKDLADLVKTFREDDLASFSEKRKFFHAWFTEIKDTCAHTQVIHQLRRKAENSRRVILLPNCDTIRRAPA